MARFDRVTYFIDEVVVDADIGKFAAEAGVN
jgi:hypothetical protein